jgi:putative transposase
MTIPRRIAILKIEQQKGPAPVAVVGPVVGIDRGICTNAVVASTTELVGDLVTIKRITALAKKLAHAQRVMARRRGHGTTDEFGHYHQSANYEKARARVAKIHSQIASQRASYLHAFTKSITSLYPVIVVEDLATTAMMKNHSLARAIAEQSWGEMGRQLRYKAERRGGVVITADRFFASSKTCSRCGLVRTKLDLGDRVFCCDGCGLEINRDLNAAINLAAWGQHEVGQCFCFATLDKERATHVRDFSRAPVR